jgi:hypothetical protein
MDFAQRWLLMLAIATAIFAICLLILRVNIRTLAILMGALDCPSLHFGCTWMPGILVHQGEMFHQNRPAHVLCANSSICKPVFTKEMCMLLDYKR